MTSECFVHITLPGATEPVVAGRFGVDGDGLGNQIGRFVYDGIYLARPDRVPLDTTHLAVLDDREKRFFGSSPVFPSLRDAAPDRWGRFVVEREHGGELDELGYLLHTVDDRAGALAFGPDPVPPSPLRRFNRPLLLPDLLEASDALLSEVGDPAATCQPEKIRLLATSMGGARPKTVVEDDEGLWVAKFPRQDDGWDNPRVEHAMLELARRCGLSACGSKIVVAGERPVLFVRRFDRERVGEGYLRHRMISAVTLLDAGESSADRARWSYPLFADELRRIAVDEAGSRRELFGRMVFNALISNVDDHPRNHALIADARGWRLAPAYDLVPTPMVSQDGRRLAMEAGRQGRVATRENLLTEAGRFGYDQEEASNLIENMRSVVEAAWHSTCRSVGVSVVDCDLISSAFVYPGFDWR